MATLVFSTVGTALGGPIGGAIGALIGQSLDRQLLAPATRGPRLGDLNVQTSSYGTQVPRLYGSMRVAGSVIWATDLVESGQTSGAKGQPDVTYSYSVSFAVALSSRPVFAIKRIWADGKLLRGAEGDFKVSTTFRFYDGSEDQPIDPLIGSIEGIANTPAHRGLALAVFENLELAEFGNRIPFLTFEVVADDGPAALASLLADASCGAIDCASGDSVVGYAAYGASIRAAVEPLVSCFDVRLFDDGSQLRSPVDSAIAISTEEFGNSADNQQAPLIEREQLPVSALAATLRLSYYDPDRDYQGGEARASAGEQSGNEVQRELPAVLAADDAKALVQAMLSREWAARDRLTLRLPPGRMATEPGASVELPLSPARWLVDKCTVDSFVTVLELHPSWKPTARLLADGGRSVSDIDVVETGVALALLETPVIPGFASDEPRILLAGTSSSAGWKRRAVSITYGSSGVTVESAQRKSALGRAATALGDGAPYLLDCVNSVDVALIDTTQWLTSCDDDALAAGANLVVLGSELIQFGAAEPLGGGCFRLSRLLRGRGGSEWAAGGHVQNEDFCLIDTDSVLPISLPSWAIGASIGAADRSVSADPLLLTGESVRPLAPVFLATEFGPDGSLALSWIRRSRSGWSWIDEVDAPLGESREQYRVTVTGTAGLFEVIAEVPTLTIDAADLAGVGTGAATIEVRQIGDLAASRAARTTIILP